MNCLCSWQRPNSTDAPQFCLCHLLQNIMTALFFLAPASLNLLRLSPQISPYIICWACPNQAFILMHPLKLLLLRPAVTSPIQIPMAILNTEFVSGRRWALSSFCNKFNPWCLKLKFILSSFYYSSHFLPLLFAISFSSTWPLNLNPLPFFIYAQSLGESWFIIPHMWQWLQGLYLQPKPLLWTLER